MNLNGKILVYVAVVITFTLLYLFSAIIIPFMFALFLSLIFRPIIMKLLKWKLPKIIIIPLILVFTSAILFLFYWVISFSVVDFISEKEYFIDKFTNKIDLIIQFFLVNFNIRLEAMLGFENIFSYFSGAKLEKLIGGTAGALGSFTGSFVMFLIYYVIFLSGMDNYEIFLQKLGGENKSISAQFDKIKETITSYLIIKTLLSLLTGILVFLVCVFSDLSFAFLFGFMAFLLNFIPSFGSIAATVLPSTMAMIEFDSSGKLLLVLGLLVAIQFVIGNIVEPTLMGNRMKLNTLTVLVGLLFWGWIWGVPGMILSVPMLTIMKQVFEKSDNTSIIARIMDKVD